MGSRCHAIANVSCIYITTAHINSAGNDTGGALKTGLLINFGSINVDCWVLNQDV